MKIRSGFVSNSSTSSFCIYGIMYRFENSKDGYDGWDELEKIFKDTGISIHSGPEYSDSDGYYIGREYTSIKDNETGLQFKKSTEDIITKKLKEAGLDCPETFNTIERAWYNG